MFCKYKKNAILNIDDPHGIGSYRLLVVWNCNVPNSDYDYEDYAKQEENGAEYAYRI